MQTTPEMRQESTHDRHRRQTRREIWLPAAIGLAVLVVAVLSAAFVSTRYEQLSLVSNFVLTLLIICPAALCAFPLAIGLVIAAVGMNNVHDWSEVKLDSVNRFSYGINRRIDGVMERLGRAGVTIGTKAAPLEKTVLSAFDRPERTAGNEGKHEPTATRTTHPTAKTGRRSDLEN